MRRIVIGLLILSACASTTGGAGTPDGGGGPDPVDAGEPDAPAPPDPIDAAPAVDAAVDADLSCPIYQDRCNGSCIPTSTDPANCGDCGVTCGAGQVCSAGACTDSCLPGLSECDQRCVDLDSDSAHCGACGHVCAPGTGCAERTCVPVLGSDEDPAMCAGGGPPIDLGEGNSSGCVAQTTFQWAICSCTDVNVSANLKTDAFDSTLGPYAPGGVGGSIGMNDEFLASGTSDIGGAMWASSPAGTHPSSTVHVGQELHIGGPFSPKTMTIGGQAFVDGNVSTSGSIVFADVLHQELGATVSGNVSYASRVEQSLFVPPPCPCQPGDLLPIAALVTAAATANDNALIGLQANALASPAAATRLDLPCGRYYLTGIGGAYAVTIVAHGHTALFIDGNVSLSKALTITLDPDATLDVLVSGNFGSSGPLAIGSPNYPLSRFYIAGTSGFSISSGAQLGAFFYAPSGKVGSSASLEVYGGVFAGDFHNSGTTAIHYDQAVLGAGDACEDDGCDSCHDCGNQACVDGACGPCTDSSQCCAPLVCSPLGNCVPVIN